MCGGADCDRPGSKLLLLLLLLLPGQWQRCASDAKRIPQEMSDTSLALPRASGPAA